MHRDEIKTDINTLLDRLPDSFLLEVLAYIQREHEDMVKPAAGMDNILKEDKEPA